MITEQERLIRQKQGYDIGFEYNDKNCWINSSTWSDEKAGILYEEFDLCAFREDSGSKNLVIYNPEYFKVLKTETDLSILVYRGQQNSDIQQPINMSVADSMFIGYELEHLDLSNWDVSKIVSCKGMFTRCTELETINLGEWATPMLRYIDYMFYNCNKLKAIEYKTFSVPNIETASYAFCRCSNLKQLDLHEWNVTHLHNMEAMFSMCKQLHSLNLRGWGLIDMDKINVTNVLYQCYKLEELHGLKKLALLEKLIQKDPDVLFF